MGGTGIKHMMWGWLSCQRGVPEPRSKPIETNPWVLGTRYLGLVPEAEAGRGACLLRAGEGLVPLWQLWRGGQGSWRSGVECRPSAGLAAVAPSLLCIQPWADGGWSKAGGAPSCWHEGWGASLASGSLQARRRGIRFHRAVLLAGWAEPSQAPAAAAAPQVLLSQPVYPAGQPPPGPSV